MLHRSSLALTATAFFACTRVPPTPPGGAPTTQAPDLHPSGADTCDDAPQRTFDDLEGSDAAHIALDGVPRAAMACTELECTDGRACCNRCDGEYVLSDNGRQVNLRGLAGCSGMDCAPVCEPFGRKPTHAYRFVGRYDHAQRVLLVEKFCRQ